MRSVVVFPTMDNIVNNSLRYCLAIDVTHVSDSISPKVSATLYVWPGAYGKADTTTAMSFYTEYNDPGNL